MSEAKPDAAGFNLVTKASEKEPVSVLSKAFLVGKSVELVYPVT
jgi:hypothetical protein